MTLRQAIELLKTTTAAAAITIPNLYYGAPVLHKHCPSASDKHTVRRAGENCSPISQTGKLSKVRVICL